MVNLATKTPTTTQRYPTVAFPLTTIKLEPDGVVYKKQGADSFTRNLCDKYPDKPIKRDSCKLFRIVII